MATQALCCFGCLKRTPPAHSFQHPSPDIARSPEQNTPCIAALHIREKKPRVAARLEDGLDAWVGGCVDSLPAQLSVRHV